jgi:hypothetical protein
MFISKSSLLTALLIVTTSSMALAQEQEQNPGRIKSTGEAMQGHLHSTYQRFGQERSRILYYNAVIPRVVGPQETITSPSDPLSDDPTPIAETRELITAIRRDLKASDKALAKLKLAHAKDVDVLKQIALIENHHAKAHDACNIAEGAYKKDDLDQVVISQCCSAMWHELEAAQVDTQELMKMLKLEKLAPPRKLETERASTK